MTGMRVAMGFAFTTVVAAETVNGMPGIGGMVRDAQRFNQTDVVVLGIIVIGALGRHARLAPSTCGSGLRPLAR